MHYGVAFRCRHRRRVYPLKGIPRNPHKTPTRRNMPNYQNGKVYRILQDGKNTVYVGSTTRPLSERMAEHRKGFVKFPHLKLYKLMAEVGVNHFDIELIIDCPCDRREVLNRAEGEQIRRFNTIVTGCNAKLAGDISHAENLAQTSERMRRYRQRKSVATVAKRTRSTHSLPGKHGSSTCVRTKSCPRPRAWLSTCGVWSIAKMSSRCTRTKSTHSLPGKHGSTTCVIRKPICVSKSTPCAWLKLPSACGATESVAGTRLPLEYPRAEKRNMLRKNVTCYA